MYLSDSKHSGAFSKSARPWGQMGNAFLGLSQALGLASVPLDSEYPLHDAAFF